MRLTLSIPLDKTPSAKLLTALRAIAAAAPTPKTRPALRADRNPKHGVRK